MSAPAISTKRTLSIVSLPGALTIAAVALAVTGMIALSLVNQPAATGPSSVNVFAAGNMGNALYQHTIRENQAEAAPAGPNINALYQHTIRENQEAAPPGPNISALYEHLLRENDGN